MFSKPAKFLSELQHHQAPRTVAAHRKLGCFRSSWDQSPGPPLCRWASGRRARAHDRPSAGDGAKSPPSRSVRQGKSWKPAPPRFCAIKATSARGWQHCNSTTYRSDQLGCEPGYFTAPALMRRRGMLDEWPRSRTVDIGGHGHLPLASWGRCIRHWQLGDMERP
jgi:hypothetical protein